MSYYLVHAELEADAALALSTLAHLRPLVALRLVVFSVHRFRTPSEEIMVSKENTPPPPLHQVAFLRFAGICVAFSSVSDPNPDSIREKIRIRMQEGKNEPQKYEKFHVLKC